MLSRSLSMRGKLGLGWLALWGALAWGSTALAQNNVSSVGGIDVDPSGVIRNLDRTGQADLARLRAQVLAAAPGEMRGAAELRLVSLARLQAAIADHLAKGTPLPAEMQYLAGLQGIRYVFVLPEQNDIVLGGFGEGWKADDRGNVVGLTTGRPVLQLDDLLVALRTADLALRGQVSCSIDPTPEGVDRLRQLVGRLRTIGDPQATSSAIEQALGPQVITINGVPATTRYAQVLVAADYRMKRLGMGFDPSPVAGLPSYLQLIPASGRGLSSIAPRWWMVPNYAPLRVDGEGLTFELRSQGAKTLTEDTYFSAQGAQRTGQTSPAAQRWADAMTAKYAELAAREPIFAELQNIMDLTVVAGLIRSERLDQRAGLDLAPLTGDDRLAATTFNAPKQTPTIASALKKGSNWIITASGGVQMDVGSVLAERETTPSLGEERARVAAETTRWWWNATAAK